MIMFTVATLAVAGSAAAQTRPNPIVLQLDDTVIEVGEVVSARVTCTNIGQPDAPPQAVFPKEGLRVELIGAPSRSSRTSIVNGRMSKRDQIIYRMQVTGLKAGTFLLGPVTVTVQGRSYATRPVKIVVREPTTNNAEHGDRYLFVELDVKPTTLFVTEDLTAELTIGIRKVMDRRGQAIPMDLLREVIDQRRSQFSVFGDAQVRPSEVWLTDSSGTRNRYTIYRATKTMRMDEVGETVIGPIFLRANYPTAVRRGFFGSYEATATRKETARADAVRVVVQGPPAQGRPDDYYGAIGRYRLAVSAKPLRVEQGQPLTLTVSIQGTPIEGVAAPDLSRNAELYSRFEFTTDEMVGDVSGRRKVFRRAVFPRQPGAQTIPPLSWSYFDPQQRRYVTLVSEAIPITVDPPAEGTMPVTITDTAAGNGDATNLTVLTGGISPNYVDPAALLVSQSFHLTGGWTTAMALSPVSWLVVTLVARHRRRLRADGGFARRRQARRQALLALDRAVRKSAAGQQWAELVGAMTTYLVDRFNRPPGELTPDEVRSLLVDHGAGEDVARQVAELLDSCNTARFAPQLDGSTTVERAAATFKSWIRQIEKTTR